ncbi:MAG: phosphoribosylformylglycinamidine cyclo-ligase [bacterium]|nr:phosphoribosylformylglycinamidine cyclo-ligase [bacterium]
MINSNYVSYKDAGVDIDYGDESVKQIQIDAKKTERSGSLTSIGGFAGLFSLKGAMSEIDDPVLVSGTDGVGTKLLVAIEANRHESIGQDLVAMCANDVLCSGAKPLFFLDYFSAANLKSSPLVRVVSSIAKACSEIDCVLLGGESAEMPGLYAPTHYDLAGFCVGVVERKNIIDGKDLAAGDQIIGLHSSGLHSNGFSLARKIIFEHMHKNINDEIILSTQKKVTVADLLLEPTKLYVKSILALIEAKIAIKAMAHITGGGISGNLQRSFPSNFSAVIDTKSWEEPYIFSLIKKHGPVLETEMRKTFNLGIGFTLVVSQTDSSSALDILKEHKESATIIGHVIEKTGPVIFLEK